MKQANNNRLRARDRAAQKEAARADLADHFEEMFKGEFRTDNEARETHLALMDVLHKGLALHLWEMLVQRTFRTGNQAKEIDDAVNQIKRS